jgi:hypothetical protein
MLAPLVAGETLNNKIWMYSYGDRLEGFGRPIAATAGLRMSAAAGAISGNEIDLTLLDTLMISTGIADLQLFGARTVAAAGDVAAGDGNVLRVTMSNVTGSAPPSPALLPASPPGAPIPLNSYGDAFTTSSTGTGIGTNLGTGNRLVITGSPNAFSRTNPRIRPMPSVRFFTNSR